MTVGIDIIRIDRIEKMCKKPSFLARILTKTEKKYVNDKVLVSNENAKLPFSTIAGIFAAKEAVSKALGVGLLRGVGFQDIEIDHDKFGAPLVRLFGKAFELATGKKASVSIAHDGEYATAVCSFFK